MMGSGDKREDEKWPGGRPHEEFLELSALSTSGELSEQEQKRLQDHVATCADCRQALREFEAVADVGVPLLSSELSASALTEAGAIPGEGAEPTAPPLQVGIKEGTSKSSPRELSKGLILAHRNGHGRTQMNWSYVWMSLAAAVVLAATLGIYSYQFGRHTGQEVSHAKPNTPAGVPDTRVDALEQQISDIGHEREVLRTQLAQRDGTIAELRRRIAEQSTLLDEAKNVQASLEHSLQNDQTEKQEVAQERSSFAQKLDAAQASLQKTQSELDSLGQQRSQEQSRAENLEAQIRDLRGQLRDRELTINRQDELLAHDRDIRDLMGARDLYIAEVYDVARDGATQKPYGRVFYTRGKSLIFYAYDLDKQPGAKNASTFQAWGRSGSDNQQVLNLGIFYQDSAAKKRWVLKLDDPRTLEQIQTVFVTVEPSGGSHKPSGKPLLFASLKIEPNHP
jgi:putative zinc finger protein